MPGLKNYFRLIALAFGLATLSACSHNPITNPKPAFLDTEIDYGPPEYRAGYHDGCQTAMSVYGNTMMKTMYKLSYHSEYANNKMYNQIWKDSWNYCYMWVFSQKQDNSLL